MMKLSFLVPKRLWYTLQSIVIQLRTNKSTKIKFQFYIHESMADCSFRFTPVVTPHAYHELSKMADDAGQQDCLLSKLVMLFCTRFVLSLARRESPAEGPTHKAEGANIDRRLVPYHGKCKRMQSRIEFIYIYIYIYKD